jgi:hypothetical protein
MATSLGSTAALPDIPPSIMNAANAGLEKLNQYYGEARQNQFIIIATSKSIRGHRGLHYSLLIYSKVCHPGMRAKWFEEIQGETEAEVLIQHVYDEYAEKFNTATTKPATVAPPADPNDFLASALKLPNFSEAGTTSSCRTELERYLAGEGGSGDLYNALAWWRVCHSPLYSFKFMTCSQYLSLHRSMRKTFRFFQGLPETS